MLIKSFLQLFIILVLINAYLCALGYLFLELISIVKRNSSFLPLYVSGRLFIIQSFKFWKLEKTLHFFIIFSTALIKENDIYKLMTPHLLALKYGNKARRIKTKKDLYKTIKGVLYS